MAWKAHGIEVVARVARMVTTPIQHARAAWLLLLLLYRLGAGVFGRHTLFSHRDTVAELKGR